MTDAPRRSSRISAQAKSDQAPSRRRKAQAADKPVKAKKRAAAETGETQDAKKVKLPAEEEDGVDELAGEGANADVAAAEVVMEVLAGAAASSSAPAPAPAPTAIDVGDVLPSVLLKNEKGEDVDTGGIAADRGVVLFLVPKADTPGCTTQACAYRDVWQEFGALAYDVYCLSADSPTAQTKWQTKKQLPYSLLSDPQRTLITALGAADGNKTKRSHFVFEKGGRMVDKKIPVKPADSSRLALEFIKGLGGN